jgi:hypothetical protein
MVVSLVDEKAAGPDPRLARRTGRGQQQTRTAGTVGIRLASLFRAPDARVSGRDVGRLSLDASGA